MIAAVQQGVTVEQYEFFALAHRSIIAYPYPMCFNVGMSNFEQLSLPHEPSEPVGAEPEPSHESPEQDPNLPPEDDATEEILGPDDNDRLIREAGLTEGLITGARALSLLEDIGEDTTGMGITQAENRVHQISQAGLLPYIPRAQIIGTEPYRPILNAGLGDTTTMTVLERAAALKSLRQQPAQSNVPPRQSPPPRIPRPFSVEDREVS